MIMNVLPLTLLYLLSLSVPTSLCLPEFSKASLASLARGIWPAHPNVLGKRSTLNYNPDGSSFLWLPQDEYSGRTFYDRWRFFNWTDPTNGHVNYINRTAAFEKRLVYFEDDGTIIMKADGVTHLERGVFRDSIRIESETTYNTGLFILDLNRAPWGCAVWPAFWTVGGNWPYLGEIDIIEGVHDNEHNQVAWHTAPGCLLNTSVPFTGTVSSSTGHPHTDCNAFINYNSGCGVTEWSRASYGPFFDAQGGGVFAMKWDENDISVCTYPIHSSSDFKPSHPLYNAGSFYRAAVPRDIVDGSPNPSQWGNPSARLHSSQCDIEKYFANHSIIFDITFCGDWAGNSYATSGCPGTCEDRLMDPKNFENASWSINSLKVYQKQLVAGDILPVSVASRSAALNLLAGVALLGSILGFLTS